MKSENIAAIATAIQAAGIAVIRISGDSPLQVAEKIFKPAGKVAVADFTPNFMYAGEINADDFTDFGMCVYFKAPKSFTGEDTVEFHIHGGVAITQGVLKKILSSGARLAVNGEFTKRAFMNGKLSLASAEGLIDMINSESVSGVKAGYSLYRERFTAKVGALQEKLLAALSQIDADIDFPEEGLEETSLKQVKEILCAVIEEINALIATFRVGRRLVSGVKVAICGKPNVGKSSLLNALLNYDKAIVSDVPGTTRDVVEGSADINGARFNFYDTAGIRDADDGVEKLGVKLSEKTAAASDLVLFVMSASGIDKGDEKVYGQIKDYPHITVINKIDAGAAQDG
ncbi:MAG: tRNA uridine-5-carboxymethylaminomethyl(34) synthesis GTPase MnmE, partial [Clostridia bacterium]|nr:tRNA uridine-5-carboxymethylaminomethyl(34) synthesis GTPase MnmE [Clostridia bacterium]